MDSCLNSNLVKTYKLKGNYRKMLIMGYHSIHISWCVERLHIEKYMSMLFMCMCIT